jgi:hypothetical protein
MLIVKDAVREPLYAIVPYFNPWRWKSREKHTIRALQHFHDAGAVIVLVEVAFNRREFTFAHHEQLDFCNAGLDGTPARCGKMNGEFRHKYIPLRTKDELWLKENAINVGVEHLPYDWQQVCWLDSDIHFIRPNWVGECIQKLQHYAFLQMFSYARDVGPTYEMLPETYPHASGMGYVHAFQEGVLDGGPCKCDCHKSRIGGGILVICKNCNCPPGVVNPSPPHPIEPPHHPGHPPPGHGRPPKPGHPIVIPEPPELPEYEGLAYPPRVWPGLAWACTRYAWDAVGGLIDFAIWGGADWHMAHALLEKTEGMMRHDLHRNYKKMVMQWYYRCHTHIRGNVGVMAGSIIHNWHGKKSQRGYNTKHALLAQCGFDPLRHLKRDYQGIYQLHDDRSTAFVKMRDIMRVIATERNEDSIDT